MPESSGTRRQPATDVVQTIRRWAIVVLLAMLCVEVVNTARILAMPISPRRFPFDYVSQGILSAGAYVRPPARRSQDITGPIKAADRLLRHDSDLYAEYSIDSINYAYPPSSAVPMLPFGLIAQKAGMERAIQAADITWRLCVLVCILVCAALLPGIQGNRRYWLAAIVVLAAFYPLRWMLVCVQIQSLITLALVLGILAYGQSRQVLSGLLIGIACGLKPHYGLLVLFGLARKRWRFSTAVCVSAGCMILVSLALAGPTTWETFCRKVVPAHSPGYAFYPNQTLNGLVHRWLGHPATVIVAPATPAIKVTGIISLVLFGGLALWPRRGGTPRTPSQTAEPEQPEQCLILATDLGIAVLAMTLANPIAWEHYFAWTIVLFCLLVAIAARTPLSAAFPALLAASYFLIGTYWRPFTGLSAGPASLVNSFGLFGAVLLLGISWYGQSRLAGKGPLHSRGSSPLP